ncbi:glycoside hydrolase family 73 protein [Oenococcus alcoholitolerans]|uniref:glycoside hydrolase family 73 protein n=1 Tax=Oenococcus alcoholitolerans TaxID=931074 RepID=UPI003F6ED1EB
MKKSHKSKRKIKDKKQQFFSIAALSFIALLLLSPIWLTDQARERPQVPQRSTGSQREDLQRQNFIKQTAPFVQQRQRQDRILSSITLAQMILESSWGQSELAVKYHNYFGVKSSDPNNSVRLSTREFRNGRWETVTANFAVYSDWRQSVINHNQLFLHGTTWNPNQYSAVVGSTDYKQAAHALVSSSYATDPGYAQKLIDLIQRYDLNRFDNI